MTESKGTKLKNEKIGNKTEHQDVNHGNNNTLVLGHYVDMLAKMVE